MGYTWETDGEIEIVINGLEEIIRIIRVVRAIIRIK